MILSVEGFENNDMSTSEGEYMGYQPKHTVAPIKEVKMDWCQILKIFIDKLLIKD